jgi:antitoxin (DNA-binding transcriptional repressor) of toxin-antitoxin stability system
MKILAVRELKERIDEILCLVEEGETVEVIDRGKVVVRLVPGDQPQRAKKRDQEAFWRRIDKYAAELGPQLPEEIDAVEIVRDVRQEL